MMSARTITVYVQGEADRRRRRAALAVPSSPLQHRGRLRPAADRARMWQSECDYKQQTTGSETMTESKPYSIGRRTIIKATAAAGLAQIAAPFVISARAADNIKIGLDDCFTGTYAETGTNEKLGAMFAVDEINKKA